MFRIQIHLRFCLILIYSPIYCTYPLMTFSRSNLSRQIMLTECDPYHLAHSYYKTPHYHFWYISLFTLYCISLTPSFYGFFLWFLPENNTSHTKISNRYMKKFDTHILLHSISNNYCYLVPMKNHNQVNKLNRRKNPKTPTNQSTWLSINEKSPIFHNQ